MHVKQVVQFIGAECGSYVSSFARHDASGILARTMANRHRDHLILLADARRDPAIAYSLGLCGGRLLFIDIGPGIANDVMPGQSAVEVALAFPDMRVVAIDLPVAIEKFQMHILESPPHRGVMALPNLTVVAGDARESLRSILRRNDAVGGRPVPQINAQTSIVIRVANSADIYCSADENERFLSQWLEDFGESDVLLLYNQAIFTKRSGSWSWTLTGKVSSRGFNHRTREITPYGPGQPPPYRLFSEEELEATELAEVSVLADSR